MARIFISYRRDDTAGHAGWLNERLSNHFGQDEVFRDINTLEPGVDFVEEIQREVSTCDVLIAMIGRNWLTVTDAAGRLRLENPEDFVRLEIGTALQRNIRVIPVLVHGATPPRAADLPDDLKPLARRHAIELSDARWSYDVARLVEAIEKVLRSETAALEQIEHRELANKPEKSSAPQQVAAEKTQSSHVITPANADRIGLLDTFEGHTGAVRTVAFGPLGNIIASGSSDKTVKLWRVADGVLLRSLEGHSGSVRSISFAPDGYIFASASNDRTVKLWRIRDGALLHTLEGHNNSVSCVTFSPDGQLLASASSDQTIRLWRSTDAKLLRTIKCSSVVWSVIFTPDGQDIISDDTNATARRVSDGSVQHTFRSHSGYVSRVKLTADGQVLATASADTTIYLWHTTSGKVIKQLEGHAAQVTSIAFAPSGQILTSMSEDGMIKIWRVPTGELLTSFAAHSTEVYTVAFSPDGTLLASAGADGTVRLWGLPQ